MDNCFLLRNEIKKYTWGDSGFIPALLQLDNPEKEPYAEMWMGAHDSSPSQIRIDGKWQKLNELVSEHPLRYLGPKVSRQFHRLPFLFKILAAGQPLSIQVHPSKRQAEEGFRKENDRGIPLAAAQRNYKDDNHKPEIIRALTPFVALKGFRPVQEIFDYFALFASGHPRLCLSCLLEMPEKEALSLFYDNLLLMNDEDLGFLIDRALEFCKEKDSPETRWIRSLAEKYPGDPGILSPLYLNLIELEPGEALYLPAGELHAYLSGVGVELMASSDNVLRGGLTVKHKDSRELMSIVEFSSSGREPLMPELRSDGWMEYRTPSEEFRLLWAELKQGKPLEYQSHGPAIALCLDGETEWNDGAEHKLRAGQSFFLPAHGKSLQVSGKGTLAMAVVP